MTPWRGRSYAFGTLTLAATTLLACSGFAQQRRATGTVTGVVVNGLGEPMPAAEVWCTR